jgi:hypothetical protein
MNPIPFSKVLQAESIGAPWFYLRLAVAMTVIYYEKEYASNAAMKEE